MAAIDLTQFPTLLANALGIDEFAAGIVASVLLMSFILLPMLFITRGRNFFAIIIIGLSSMGICVALAWMPFWFLIITVMLTALLFADRFRRAMS